MEKQEYDMEFDYNAFIEDFYARNDAESISDSEKKQFIRRVLWEFMKGVLGYMTDDQKSSRTNRIVETIQKNDIFPFQIEGIENLEACDLIIGNHQGGSSPDGSKGQAPENVFVYSSVPNSKTKILLKDDLVDGSDKDFLGKLQARGLRNLDPLVFQRLPDLPEDADRRMQAEYAQKTRAEMNRVMDEVFSVIDSGHPVLLYGEGTRSETGRILPLVSTFFDRIFEDHILPSLQKGEPIRIGLLIADTMQTFLEGLSPRRPVMNRPMTLKGIQYQLPESLVVDMQSVSSDFDLNASQKKLFSKRFKMDIQEQMKRELASLLLRTTEEGKSLDSLEKQLDEGQKLQNDMSEAGGVVSHPQEMRLLSDEIDAFDQAVDTEKERVFSVFNYQ